MTPPHPSDSASRPGGSTVGLTGGSPRSIGLATDGGHCEEVSTREVSGPSGLAHPRRTIGRKLLVTGPRRTLLPLLVKSHTFVEQSIDRAAPVASAGRAWKLESDHLQVMLARPPEHVLHACRSPLTILALGPAVTLSTVLYHVGVTNASVRTCAAPRP